MKVVLIGSGNVATHLGIALKAAGHAILQVWSRNRQHAQELADQLFTTPISTFDHLTDEADIYILSVKDEAISDLARQFPFRNKLIVHTSGATDLIALEGASSATGVLYPLQTFSKKKPLEFKNIPIAVEGSSAKITEMLLGLASGISDHVHEISSEKRKVLHVAAVFACNFNNHLYTIAEKILKREGLSFSILGPLITETAGKALELSPLDVQTGPAARNDLATIERHLLYLESEPHLQELYKMLSNSILNQYRL